MKKLALVALLLASASTHAESEFHPKNCTDGGVYRSMTGAQVSVDANQNKTLRNAAGTSLISCTVGNSGCAPYNAYQCTLNLDALAGTEEAQLARANLEGLKTEGVQVGHNYAAGSWTCGFMHCEEISTLRCAADGCKVDVEITGWDE